MIPCRNCLCLAACRHKLFRDLTEECTLIFNILYGDDTFMKKRQSGFAQSIYEIRRILKPTKWTIRQRYNSKRAVDIVNKKMRGKYVSM